MRSIFFSSIAHELRTPMNSILPICEKLKDCVNATGMKYLKIVTNSTYHLSHIIEDALDMSRIENKKFSLNFEDFDIRKVVEDIREIMEFQIESKNLKFVQNVDESVPRFIYSD